MEKIQLSYNAASPVSKTLQQVIWFNTMFHLIHRRRENLSLLTNESFTVQTDVTEKKFVYPAVDKLDRKDIEKGNPNDSPGTLNAWFLGRQLVLFSLES